VLRVLRGALPVILMCLMIGIRAAADIVAVRRFVSMDSLAWSTVLVAGLSYRFLETPFLRLKERFSQLRSAKSPKVVVSVAAQQS
jgi:peptidoglycan/LPS O-acetylase OafA/YrhL